MKYTPGDLLLNFYGGFAAGPSINSFGLVLDKEKDPQSSFIAVFNCPEFTGYNSEGNGKNSEWEYWSGWPADRYPRKIYITTL